MPINKGAANVAKITVAILAAALMGVAVYYASTDATNAAIVPVSAIKIDRQYLDGKGDVLAASKKDATSQTVWQSATATATVLPSDAADQTILWESSDESKVTVASAQTVSGDANTIQMVTPFEGVVYVYAMSTSDHDTKAAITVTNYNETVSASITSIALGSVSYHEGSDAQVANSAYVPEGSSPMLGEIKDNNGNWIRVADSGSTQSLNVAVKQDVPGATGTKSSSVNCLLTFEADSLYPSILPSYVTTSGIGTAHISSSDPSKAQQGVFFDPLTHSNAGKNHDRAVLVLDGAPASSINPKPAAQAYYWYDLDTKRSGLDVSITFTHQAYAFSTMTFNIGEASESFSFNYATSVSSVTPSTGGIEF